MLDMIATGLSSLNAARELANAMQGVATANEVASASIKLNAQLLEVQSALFAAQAEIATISSAKRDLEEQVARLHQWAVERERYQLTDAGQGTLVYRLKPSMDGGDPPHDICPRCYEDGIKAILQPYTIPQGRVSVLSCGRCKTEFVTRGLRMSGVR